LTTPLTELPGTLRPLLRLALPVLAEQLLSMLVGFSDQLLAGWYLDQPHLAAVNSMVYMLWLLASLFVFVTIAATAMIARFVGAHDFDLARRVVNQAFLAGGVLAVVLTLVGLLLAGQIVAALQLGGQSGELATRYLYYVFPVLPLLMCESVGNACLRGAGDMVTGLTAMILTNVVNIAVSWSLVLGWGPLPRLGWDGLAIGTACGFAVGGTFVAGRLLRGRAGLKLGAGMLRPDANLIRRLLRIGLPGGSDVMLILFCQLWFLSIVNQLGELPAAAHGVAVRIESLAYLPGTAFQVAAATLAGQFLGARDLRRAGRSVLLAVLAGGGLMTAAGVLFFAAAEPLARLFLRPEQTDVIVLASLLLRIVAFAMPPLALTMILNGALRGAGDTVWPFLFSVVGYLGVRIPLAYLLAQHWNLGVAGAWYAMLADLTVRCLLVSVRFLQGGWKRVRV
jgi:putative MATE family efflux protein